MAQKMDSAEVLLVEDRPEDAEITIRALKRRNFPYQIFHLKNGAEALDFLFCAGDYIHRNSDIPPRVIILDLKLPKVSGLEILQKIKSDMRTRKIPVVMLTSSKEGKDVEDSYRLGANSYIVKPIDFDEYSEAVSSVVAYWLQLNEPPPKNGPRK